MMRPSSQSATAAQAAGKRFALGENALQIAEIGFDFADGATTLIVRNDQGEHQIPCGYGEWQRSEANFGPLDASPRPAAPRQPGPWRIAASGAWTNDATYTAKLWWYETPFARTLTCRFAGDRLTVEWQPNAAFGPLDPTHLEGKVAQ